MSQHIPFTDNYDDISTDRGFQFRFRCERCGNGYQSTFAPNITGMAGDALRAASGLFGGFLSRAADSAYDIQRMVGGPAHDKAMRAAVEEISPEFTQCGRCGQWVCRSICWNGARNQCVTCSPRMDHELAAIESAGTISQLHRKTYDGSVDLTQGVEMSSAATGQKSVAATESCPHCGVEVTSGAKFCGDCGNKIQRKVLCPNCGVEAIAAAKFCGDCGTKMSG
ncbi:Double zinc ribbon [Abditibacterium utsteinense]|uniref:Double zinc ribbon n=1 Tax=Abditibacterium utsteinense TaxID=1960156 RepID=A0A2S8SUQ6_9BACT|nr:zinc ribbon domain-containing protein [Abditibacterium utsteinense]PQV64528.1 Double zinc ribbon [Abditibacterium utsteinense]